MQTTLDDYHHPSCDGEEGCQERVPSKANPQEYVFDGVKIRFPFEAYPCQLELLQNIVKTLNGTRENALLESPTGSGKSMSILCGVLGWLEHKKHQHRAEAERLVADQHSTEQAEGHGIDQGEEDFMVSKRAKVDAVDKEVSTKVRLSLPKIYICSRTHRQIAQLVKELSRTSYEPKFVVLGSRSHYCIHDEVRKSADINERCRTQTFSKSHLRGGGCIFFNNLSKAARKRTAEEYTPDCDIEDLVKRGKAEKFCPYFSTRAALEYAEVVFAPYNYLVDPVVREAMGIELRQDIVIIDEAHNIEDCCREAGSFEITDDALSAIQGELLTISKNLRERPQHADLLVSHECQGHLISLLLNWMKHGISERGVVRRDFETSITIWQDKSIVDELQSVGINYQQASSWLRELQKIVEKIDEQPKASRREEPLEEKVHLLSFGSCQALKGLYNGLFNMLRDNNLYLSSYRMVKYQSTKIESSGRRVVLTLGFWCLNPEVIFKPLVSQTKSVILTSGTLSPMDTFSSELSTRFEQRLEALHIISESQTWVGCVPYGPAGAQFLGNYKTMDSFAYQDDLCRSIMDVTRIVPGGVLCFLPSYGYLDKLIQRMKNIGIYDTISKVKKIFFEPRQGTPKDFEKLLKNYYRVIRDTKGALPSSTGLTGALLFAVYRGKISEGLDLRDDNCRAVIPVGIPYPAFKDPRVVLKREFNDKHGLGKRLLVGQQWYESQAFRALNQALGRCIRHRYDWGAIILLEQRFTIARNVAHLSRWVQKRVRRYDAYPAAIAALQEFISMNRGGGECEEKENRDKTMAIEDGNVPSKESIASKVPIMIDSDG